MISIEIKNQIADLWRKGFTGAQISEELSITRNTIFGIIYRMRRHGVELEERKETTGFQVKAPRKLVIKKPRPIYVKKQPKEVEPEPIQELPEQPIDNRKPVTFMNLKYDSCRYIVEDGNIHHAKYCNKKITRESYCDDHYKLCYYPSRHQLSSAAE